MDDNTIRPVSSNMRLVRRNDTYKSIDSLANQVFDAAADWVENHNNCLCHSVGDSVSQSSYFGLALTYQNILEVLLPRFQLNI